MYEDIVIGLKEELGSHTFTAESIIDFATKYDPQPFHLSEEAGRNSHFGSLVASGWHTGGMWMRMRVEHGKRVAAERAARGLPAQTAGPSGGFKNLRWPKPVRTGDTVTYFSEHVSKRPLASRPGWGIVFSLNTGVNQHGELVFSFDGSGFVPMGDGPAV
jgi:acyl dehydratase